MKYVLLIHSNPLPWGHPTTDYLEEHQSLPEEQRKQMADHFDRVFGGIQEAGELVNAEALGDPSTARLYRWEDGKPMATDGPYSEAKEHLAGFFVIDVEDEASAHEFASSFAGPGETIELRPAVAPDGRDAE